MGHEPNPGDVKREQGSFYFCRQHPEDDKKAIVEAKFDKIDISNGLEWSLDGKTLYYIDTLTFKVEAFDYQATGGVISNRRTVFDLKAEGIKGYPDGMTIDTRGHLWVACFFGSKVGVPNLVRKLHTVGECKHGVWKSQKKVSSNIASEASYV